MRVVEKIEAMGYNFPIEQSGCFIAREYEGERTGQYIVISNLAAQTKIEAVHRAAYRFIVRIWDGNEQYDYEDGTPSKLDLKKLRKQFDQILSQTTAEQIDQWLKEDAKQQSHNSTD